MCVCAFVHVHIPEGGVGLTRETHTYSTAGLFLFFFLSSTVKHAPYPPFREGNLLMLLSIFLFIFLGREM